jgi:alpha-mannosidase
VNIFAIEIWYDEGSICTFYTVRWLTDDDDAPSETDRFFDTYAVPEHSLEDRALQLFRLITESIGNRYGATDDFFDRAENKAQALPPKPKKWVEEIKDLGINFPLRLFCYRITEQIVILFNGGIKDAYSAQESKNLSMKFYEAQTFVNKIEEALQSGMIEISIDERYLKNFDGTTEIIL